jgi:hypothetical protein
MKRLKKIFETLNEIIYEFTPSLSSLYWKCDILNFGLKGKVLCLLKYPFGYRIYYALQNDCVAYYCFISYGYFVKHPYVRKREILVGPYFTKQEFRGLGIAQRALSIILKHNKYCTAFVFVAKKNIASQRVVSRNNFVQACYGDYKGLLSIFRLSHVRDDNGYIVYTKKGDL